MSDLENLQLGKTFLTNIYGKKSSWLQASFELDVSNHTALKGNFDIEHFKFDPCLT